MSDVTLHLGDWLKVLREMESKTVQACVTSPPYYGLRDYGVVGQVGLEQAPEEYIARLVEGFREVWRVLKDDGTLWINLGDSYWGGKGQSAHGGSDKQRARFERNESINRDYQEIGRHGWTAPKDGKHDIYKPKDLLMIPARVALALQADGWYLRSEIIWHKPNPMPESVTDRPTKSHEMIYLLAKSAQYFYDADAVREPLKEESLKRWKGEKRSSNQSRNNCEISPQGINTLHKIKSGDILNHAGRNRRDVWTVTTKPYKGAHFATFPPDLIEPCILAGSAEGDIVLDPFNGSGTTGQVAVKHGRKYIGIELNPNYIELSQKRLGLA